MEISRDKSHGNTMVNEVIVITNCLKDVLDSSLYTSSVIRVIIVIRVIHHNCELAGLAGLLGLLGLPCEVDDHRSGDVSHNN